MTQLPDKPAKTDATVSEDDKYARLPGPLTSSYWLVITGALLTFSVITCYCAIRYGHWHPLPDSHYPKV